MMSDNTGGLKPLAKSIEVRTAAERSSSSSLRIVSVDKMSALTLKDQTAGVQAWANVDSKEKQTKVKQQIKKEKEKENEKQRKNKEKENKTKKRSNKR